MPFQIQTQILAFYRQKYHFKLDRNTTFADAHFDKECQPKSLKQPFHMPRCQHVNRQTIFCRLCLQLAVFSSRMGGPTFIFLLASIPRFSKIIGDNLTL